MVGPSVSPLGSMLRAQAIVGRRLLVAAWRRELGTLCSAAAEIWWADRGPTTKHRRPECTQYVPCGRTKSGAIKVGF